MSDQPAERVRCRAMRRDNQPCKGTAIANGLCFAHQPEAGEWRVKGGQASSNAARSIKAMPERLKPVAELLSVAMARTFNGTLKPQQATAIAALASAFCRVVQTGELEERLRTLEAAAREAEQERGGTTWPA